MSYYKNSSSDLGLGGSILALVIVIVIMLFAENCQHSMTAYDWNNGKCPKCEVRYELRGASRGVKYYACPECGKEVDRW